MSNAKCNRFTMFYGILNQTQCSLRTKMKSSYILLLILACAPFTQVSNASRPASPLLNAASSSTADPCSEPILLTHKQIIFRNSIKDSIAPQLKNIMAQRFDIAKRIKKLVPLATTSELTDYVMEE